jgi:soluble lytic murein transglycosylase-like protein
MYEDEIEHASLVYNIPESWIRGVIEVESSWNQFAYRYEAKIKDASYGLMQLLSKTAYNLGYTGTVEGLYDPYTNIMLGTKLLAENRDRFGDDFTRVYSAYNSGNPDAYQTSTEVYNHVQKAVDAVYKYVEPYVIQVDVEGTYIPVWPLWLLLLLFMYKRKVKR